MPRSPRRALLLAVAATLGLTTSAFAAPLPGSSFDSGDGDQADAVGMDWQAAVGAARAVESPDANDDCFVGGVKELAPNQWAFNRSAGGCTPGKSNLRVAFANPESATGTTFGHFAFFRNDTTGNTFLTFELNQVATAWTNATGTTIPCRSNGDVLISFEVGGSSLLTSVYRWTGDGTGPAACPNGASGTFLGSGTVPATRFQGAMNAAALIQNYVNPGTYGATFPANAFGEAAIDLPAVMQSMGQSPCFGFLQMQVHSRSSSSISSAMIDYTTPVPVYVQSCAVTGTQYQDTNGNGARDAGEPGLTGFRMYADLDDDGVLDTGEPSGVSDANGFYRLLNVPAGSIRIRQEPRAGWRCSQPSPCSYTRWMTTGGNSTGNDFGNLGPSTASGTTFDDLDADGVRDAGEPGLGAVRVYADLDDDGALDDSEPSTTSGPEGTFSLGDVPAGTYRIRQVDPSAWTCSTPSPCSSQHVFSSGSAVTGLAFGSYGPALLGGRVFEDNDGDGGPFGAGDAPVAGRQVYLDANGNNSFDIGERQTTTDASGLYAIAGVVPGTYTVRVTGASGWYCTRPGSTDAACERTETVVSAQNAAGRDFGLGRTATISGTTFDDPNGNGVRDAGESTTLAGFTHYVDYDGDNALDAGEPSAVSATGGGYAITGVRAGSWTLRQLPNGAYACTRPAPCTYAITVASNGTVTARDFLAYVSRSVSGTVYNDTGTIGTVPEAGETGLQGWTVFFDDNGDGVPSAGESTAVTNSAGLYNLTRTANGSYEVRVAVQAGWTCSFPAPCRNTGSIGSGQSDTGKHFGVRGPAVVTGTLFEDSDGDGAARESGEPGLSGRTVYVDLDGDGVKDAGEPEATSSATGAYSVSVGTGVAAGTYTVRQVLPAGWTCSRPVPCTFSVTTTNGSVSGRDFGSSTPGSVTGTVAEDTDADGDADTPLAGRTVALDTNGDGTGDTTATTDGTGFYAFANLAPGTYTVRQVLPAGWTQSAPAGGHTVTVASGTPRTGKNFAAWETASITGTAFDDEDFDESAREAGDDPLEGRTLYVDEDDDRVKDDGEPAATTDATGAYGFGGLRPGTHTVRAVMPGGSACSFPDACSVTVTLASGETAAGRDFGSYVGATVSGTLFEDLDADDAPREAGEGGLAGRRVYLDALGDGNGSRQADEPTTLTAADGSFSFGGVTAEDWQVRLELPAAFDCDSPTPCRHDLSLTSGSTHAGQDFGVHTTATISGHLFTDRDADHAAQEFGENDQPERTVYLDADGDGVRDDGERTAGTDDRGDFTFTGVQPGPYRVRQVLPAGWTCSTPDPCLRDVTVTSGQTSGGHTFSSWTTASFTGTYFEDEDADGEYPEPADAGVGGRTVYLDLDEDAGLDADEPTTTTAADGSFAFGDLPPETYVVRAAAQPSGWTCSHPDPCFAEITLEAAERAQDVNFGAWTSGTVSGTLTRDSDGAAIAGWPVFADLNDNGTRDGGEPQDTTGASGDYELTLEPDSYPIRQDAPTGWTCVTPDPCRHDVTVTSQAAISARDFVDAQDAFLAGTVYDDTDADGTRDPGESGRGGVRVYLETDGTAGYATGEPTTTTASDGAWDLGVDAGTHAVRVELPTGLRCDAPAGCARSVTVAAGESANGLGFALWREAAVEGVIADDADGDGTRDAGEPGIEGVSVYADADDDGTADDDESRATTDAGGAYALTGLRPGTHRVRAALGSGWRCTACDADQTVASGETKTHDVTAWRPSTIAGIVFLDSDADGAAREDGEPALEGRTVFADADDDGAHDDGEASATTGDGGGYALTGLAPGTHRVRVVVPAGWECTRPDPCGADVGATSGSTPAGPAFGLAGVNADLSVTLERTPAAVVAGRPVGWKATVANAGPYGAPNATLVITLPQDVGAVVVTPPAGVTCTREGLTLTCVLGDLAVGESVEITIDGDVDPGAGGQALPITAEARSDRPDPDATDDDAAESPVAGAIADLKTTAALPAQANAGDVVALTVEAVNGGPSHATGVRLVATLPEGLDLVPGSVPDGCTAEGRVVTCTAPALDVGTTLRRTLEVRVARDGTLVVPVAATSDQDDPTPADAATETDLEASPVADVEVLVAEPPRESGDGGVTYGLGVHNDGPSSATDVVVVDGPFPGARISSVTTSHGTCAVLANGALRCELGTLPPGTDVRVTVVLVPDAGVDPSTIRPAPAATAREADPRPANNVKTLVLAPRPDAPAAAPAPVAQAAEPRLEIAAPPAVRCASVRAFDVRVRRRRGTRLRRVQMWLAGSPIAVLRRDGRFVSTVDLRGRAPGAYVLRIRAVDASGKVLRGTRTYHTCTPKRPTTVPRF